MSNNPNYIINDYTIDIHIHKPLYGSFVYIREKYVDLAIKKGKLLKITIPEGTFERDPKEWKETGQRIEKVFLKPDEPMVLWGNHVVKLKGKETVEDKKIESQDKLFD